ncbi:MAG TPA: hypothetical protein VGD80_43915, partial [Kofleriaceae bacterium]
LGAGVAVPWALEVLEVVSPTYSFTDVGQLVIGSSILTFSPAPVQLAFVALLIILLTVVGLLSRVLAQRQRDATRRLELQAWHLEQVVPSIEKGKPPARADGADGQLPRLVCSRGHVPPASPAAFGHTP